MKILQHEKHSAYGAVLDDAAKQHLSKSGRFVSLGMDSAGIEQTG